MEYIGQNNRLGHAADREGGYSVTSIENTGKRAVLYGRVSSDEQADKGYSLPTQIEACEKYARQLGFTIVGRFQDDFTGTTPIEARPEGRKAYELLRSGAADVLIAYRIDRIVRPPEDGDEWDMPVLIRGLAKLGKEIHVCNRGELKTDFASLLIAMLDARKAGEERRDIVERTTRGRYAKARLGKVVGTGKAPYGYRHASTQTREDDHRVDSFEIVESEARIVRMIYAWYIGIDGAPVGSQEIAKRLTDLHIPTPDIRRLSKPTKYSSQGVWNIAQIRKMLSNEVYAGVWRYGRTVGYGGAKGKRTLDQVVAVGVPAIIERNVWTAALARRDYNVRLAKRNGKRDYLLRGMVRCGCGCAFTGMTYKDRGYHLYRCSSIIKRVGRIEPVCHESYVRGEKLEAVAWKYLMKVVTDREELLTNLRLAQSTMLVAAQPLQDKLSELDAMIAEAAAEAARCASEMSQYKDSEHSRPSYKALRQKRDDADARYEELGKKRSKVQAEIDEVVITDETIVNIVSFSETTINGLENPTQEQRRRWLEYLRIEVKIEGKKAIVKCMLPVKAEVIDLTLA